ncbi:MAG: GldG family protein [Oscillospiraceae bacterium]|nr:GldG family protein [Oscillospiraceae bacterium]
MAKKKNEAEINSAEISSDGAVEKKKGSFNKRKLKYGSIAAAITIIVVAIVVLVNVIVNMASNKVNMSIDLTTNGNFEISQQTIDYLNTLNQPVNIVCLSDELTFQTATYIYYKQAYEVLKKYSIYSDLVNLTFVDMIADPTYAERYKESYKGEINQYSIIVENEANGRIKVFGIQDLYNTESQFDYSSFSYAEVPVSSKAEQEITSAIMYVTDPDPIKAVVFKSETSGTSYDNVYNLLASNGYEVSEINPLAETIPEDTDIVVINAPLNDYDSTVIDMLYAFLDNDGKLGRSLIYFADYSQKTMSNMGTFLEEWGIRVEDGIVADSDMNNLQSQNLYVIRDYITENDYSTNLANSSLPVIDFQSRPLTLLFENKDTRSTVPLLQTKDTAFIMTDEVQQAIKNGDTAGINYGVQTTMALGRKYIFDEENQMVFSNVLVIGSSETLDESFTSTTYFNNGDYFISVVNTMAGKNSGISIVAKDLGADSFDIDSGTANRYFTLFIVIIPVAVLIIGTVVFIRRRSK